MTTRHIRNSTAEFLIFTGQSGEQSIEARYEDDSIWLSQKLMAELFAVDVRTISEPPSFSSWPPVSCRLRAAGPLLASLTVKLVLTQQPMHGADRAQVNALLEQAVIDLRRRLIGIFIAGQHLGYLAAFCFAQRPWLAAALPLAAVGTSRPHKVVTGAGGTYAVAAQIQYITGLTL